MLFAHGRGVARHHARRSLLAGMVALAIACLGGGSEMPAAEIPAAAPNAAEAFPFEALDGSAIEFDASARCHVIAFLGAGCPASLGGTQQALERAEALPEMAVAFHGRACVFSQPPTSRPMSSIAVAANA